LKYLSVCSGIEAASVAWHPLGWQPVAFSEIEPFPSAVLAHHYPNVPNLGDMTKFTEWPDEPVDLLVGGTPCQSFSVAGLRKGLEDPRGNLMLTYLAIAQRYRPRWVVWENVPGVLSSNGGRDFGTFLGALGELGYGWAYRVLDAQWFGVAQRRRRVFVVGHLGDWQRAAAVLFERESVRRDSPPSREARQGVAGGVGGSVANGSAGVTPHIFKVRGGVEREDGSRGSTNIGKQAGKGYLGSEERAFTLAAAQDQFVAQPVAWSQEVADPLTANEGRTYTHEGSNNFRTRNVQAVAQPAATAMQVRRLTPVECERLQGFPDGYTNIPWRKKPEAPDGPRYKALGNSMAVPCMAWIGKRIAEVDRGD
jgi:DNA (cytosine-5)-methyltransferase 1